MTRFPPLADAAAFSRCLPIASERFSTHGLDNGQAEAVFAPPSDPLHIVAGPGSGKTTVLVLRLLYLVFVHGYHPEEIIATTFTRKAAAELRSRILGWGYSLRDHLIENVDSEEVRDWLRTHCEFSDLRLGTFDSIVQEMLADFGPREEDPPVVIEPNTATSLMLLEGVLPIQLQNNQDLRNYLQSLNYFPINASRIAGYLRQFSDRITNDLVDRNALAASSAEMRHACRAIESFRAALARRQLIDYCGLSERFLALLRDDTLTRGMQQYRVLLVDEFQDTNCLQEACYFEIFRRFSGDERLPASLTVVGDDDQSIFRFRGATVEIFTDFPRRIASFCGDTQLCESRFLSSNFRSRSRIVSHFNDLVEESAFVSARVTDKPNLIARTDGGAHELEELPVLGMFDDDRARLAMRLREFLHSVFRADGYQVRCSDAEYLIRGTDNHDFADAVFLGSSVVESKPGRRDPLNLTGHLRAALEPDIPVFNPRGRALHEVEDVQILLGLLLNCIDADRSVQTSIEWLHAQFGGVFNGWRQRANDYANTAPSPGGLSQFIADWGARTWRGRRGRTLRDWPSIELLFTLTTWLPNFVENPEYQVYLEAVTRAVEQSGPLSPFGGRILFDDRFAVPSVKHLLINVLAPIAGSEIDVDEDLMPHVPRHWFPMMTIHQAKGLEFPLVIVDVGCGNGQEIRDFMRFPSRPSVEHYDEDLVAAYSALGRLRQSRDAVTRARDDLKRKYFVGFSRAQSVLLVVGHTSFIRQRDPLPSIQVGSRYDGSRMWRYIPADRCTVNDRDVVALI